MTYSAALHSALLENTGLWGRATSNKQSLWLISLKAPRTPPCVDQRVSPHLHQPGQASASKEAAIMA